MRSAKPRKIDWSAEAFRHPLQRVPSYEDVYGSGGPLEEPEPIRSVPERHERRDETEPQAIIRCLHDVVPEPVDWLWPGRIPLGKLTLIDGDPGTGKSTLSIDLAARVTTKSLLPDGSRSDLPGPADVIILSAEDGAADTIRPRADAAGADLHRIHLLTDVKRRDAEGAVRREPWLLPRDLSVLRRASVALGARLVIIDPFSAFLDRQVDSYRDQDVRGVLRPLAELAGATGASVVVIRHLSKSGGANAIYRGGGSIGIIGAARSGLLVAVDPDDQARQSFVLVRSKGNLAPEPQALRYRLAASDSQAVRVEWLGPSNYTANALLAEPSTREERTQREEAREIILTLLSDGPVPAKKVLATCREAGIGDRTTYKAKSDLNVRSEKPNVKDSPWNWALPDTAERCRFDDGG